MPLSTPATEGALLVPYPATLDVPRKLVEHVAWLLYEHRRARNTRWRKLGCFDQALLTLVHLRKNETFAQLGAGFAISQATAWRYVEEDGPVRHTRSRRRRPLPVGEGKPCALRLLGHPDRRCPPDRCAQRQRSGPPWKRNGAPAAPSRPRPACPRPPPGPENAPRGPV